jgi:hypothetical protein
VKVSTGYPNLTLANMLLYVGNHLAPSLQVPELTIDLNKNLIDVNEFINQPAEDFRSNRPVSLKCVTPMQGD